MKHRFRKACRATCFSVIDNPGVTITERGTGLWCIAKPGEVLGRSGRWEAEPFLNKRSQEFIGRTRWPSPEAAHDFFCGYMSSIPKKPYLLS